jgi:tetratricopeptide (TPR) repeat protein/TolB-like protein
MQRYQSAEELAADLQRPASTPTAAIPNTKRISRAPRIAGAVVILALLAAGYFFVRRNRAPAAVSTVNRRRSVAVLGFKNLSANPEKSWLSTALSEMLTTELSEGDQLRTISGESVAQMKASLALPDADSFSQQTLTRIRQNLGSDDVVLGSYLSLGDGLLRLDVRLQDAVAGVTLASVSEKGAEAEIDALVSKAGAELRAKLGAGALSEAQSAMVRATLPSNPEAARLYSQGLQKLRLFDALSARDLLEKAAQLSPDHAPTHSALAEALSIIGYESKAREQAKLALDLSPKFTREERLVIEGRSHELLGQNKEAIESYRALWEFFPDTLDYGLFLVRAHIAAGEPQEAEKVVGEVRRLTVSDADAARIDFADAETASYNSDFKHEQELAERAAVRGRAVGATLLVAKALQLEAHAVEHLGDSATTAQLARQARELYVAAGDGRGAARCLLVQGDVLYDQGDYPGAKALYESALPEFRKIGAQKSVRSTLERIGNVFYSIGKLQEAKRYYEQTLHFDQEFNDPGGVASDYGNLANTLDGLGDLPGSLKMQHQALDAFNSVGNRRGAADTLNNLGIVQIEMGDLDEARKSYEQCLAMTKEMSYLRGQPFPIAGIGDTLAARGDLAGAQKRYEEALALAKQLNNVDFAAQVGVGMASAALAQKRYAEGEGYARDSATVYEKSNSWGNSAWAEAILARNLLGQGKLEEAQSAAAKAAKFSLQSAGLTPRFESALANALVKGKLGKSAAARAELDPSLAAARKGGYRLYEYQFRLALIEIEMASGVASAAAQASALEKEVRANGAGLVADQAKALQTTK